MPKIIKRSLNPQADLYVLQPAKELSVEDEFSLPPDPRAPVEAEEEREPPEGGDLYPDVLPEEDAPRHAAREFDPDAPAAFDVDTEYSVEDAPGAVVDVRLPPETPEEPEEPEEEDPFSFAKVQAEAMMRDAEREVEAYKAEAMRVLEEELDARRKAAREEGYSRGYASGMADAMAAAKIERERLAEQQVKAIEAFLEEAARTRDRILDESREELKDLALAVAEKVIQVSLKNSGDILLRMVDAATDTHKRCEWAHIYVADCDVRGKASTVPELAAALGHISDRVRVIPMADDESGTCIVELPDVIYDASVSTQMSNIREVLNSTGLD